MHFVNKTPLEEKPKSFEKAKYANQQCNQLYQKRSTLEYKQFITTLENLHRINICSHTLDLQGISLFSHHGCNKTTNATWKYKAGERYLRQT